MGPVSHTVQLTVLGVDGITVSCRTSGADSVGTFGENVFPVSAFVSFSRHKTAVKTLPSKPLGASPEGIELNISESYSDDEYVPPSNQNQSGMRHVALWPFNEDAMWQGSQVTMQVKLHKKGDSFERKDVEVTVGLLCGGETALLGTSSLNITGCVPNMQFDLPLIRANGYERNEKRNIFGGWSTPKGGTHRTGNYGIGMLSRRDSQQDDLLTFSSDESRGYDLAADATLRVLVSVVLTKDFNHLAKEQEAARNIILQQMAMAQANHLGQPVIVNNLSNESPMSSISHTVFSSLGDAASVRSRACRSRQSDEQSMITESTRLSDSMSRSTLSERSKERQGPMYLPPRAPLRPPLPQPNPSPNQTSPRQALQLTPFSPTLTQTGRVPKGGKKPPRPLPPLHMPHQHTPEQGKSIRTPLGKKTSLVDGNQVSSALSHGNEGNGGRFSPSLTKTPKGFKLKKVLKAFSPRTTYSNTSAPEQAAILSDLAPNASHTPVDKYHVISSPVPNETISTQRYTPNLNPALNGHEAVSDIGPTIISDTIGNSLSDSIPRMSDGYNESSEHMSRTSHISLDSFKNSSPSKGLTTLEIDKDEKGTIETSTSLTEDMDTWQDRRQVKSGSKSHTKEKERTNAAFHQTSGASHHSHKRLDKPDIPLSKEIRSSKEKPLYDKLLSGLFCRDDYNYAANANETDAYDSNEPPKIVVAKMTSDESVGELTLTTFERREDKFKLIPAVCGGGGVCAAPSNVPRDAYYEYYNDAQYAGNRSRGKESAEQIIFRSSSGGGHLLESHHRQRSGGSRSQYSKNKAQVEEYTVGEDTRESIEAARETLRRHADKLGVAAVYEYEGRKSEHAGRSKDDDNLWATFDDVCQTDERNIRYRRQLSEDESSGSSTSGSSSSSDSSQDNSTMLEEEYIFSRHGRNTKRGGIPGKLAPRMPHSSRIHRTNSRIQGGEMMH